MARKALGPATVAVHAAVAAAWAGEGILVACSGGSDSTALALAAGILAARRGAAVRAVIVDHGLQPTSAQWSAAVADRLAVAGIGAEVVPVEVRRTGAGLEADARAARYRALSRAARPGERVYLGHTLDDQAETVLLGLARGSGIRSLAGMRPIRDGFVRPLLGLRSAVTTEACRELGVDWIEDPHNAQPRFARTRVRTVVLPVLEAELGPGVAEALARTAELARRDADTLDELARAALPDPSVASLDCRALAQLAPGIRARVVRAWLRTRGSGEVTMTHVDAVLGTLLDRWRGQRWIDLPGLRVCRRDGHLVVWEG